MSWARIRATEPTGDWGQRTIVRELYLRGYADVNVKVAWEDAEKCVLSPRYFDQTEGWFDGAAGHRFVRELGMEP